MNVTYFVIGEEGEFDINVYDHITPRGCAEEIGKHYYDLAIEFGHGNYSKFTIRFSLRGMIYNFNCAPRVLMDVKQI